MNTRSEKRARQKEGRKLRLAAERAAFQKAQRKRRIMGWGITVVVVAGVIALFWFLTRDDSDSRQTTNQDESSEVSEPTEEGSATGEEGTANPGEDTPDDGTELELNLDDPEQESEITMPNYTPFTASDYGTTPCPPEVDPADRAQTLDFADSFQNCLEEGSSYTAVMSTTLGDIRILLDTENTPGTSNNFISLSRSGYYDGTLMHRTDTSIGIIQGGSPHTNSAADPGPGYNIKDEGTGFTYRPGQLVMARSAGLNSSGAQYFFAVNNATSLLDGQGTYVVFGNVTEGLDVLEAVLASHKDNPASGLGGAPDPDVTVNSVVIEVS